MFVVHACLLQAAAIEPLISDPVFRIIGSEQGLPSRQVQALAEDAQGRIWIGTANGLARFDGHRMVSFPARMDRPNALATTSVEALVVDQRQQLWVTTQGGYLARWRDDHKGFERVDLHASLVAEQLELWALASQDQSLWVGSYGAGLLQLDLEGHLLAQFAIPAQFGSGQVTDLQVTDDSALWLVTLDQRLLRFDLRSHQFAALSMRDSDAPPAAYGLALRQGKPWFSTRAGQVCRVAGDLQPSCLSLPHLALPGRARMLLSGERGDWVGGRGELLRTVQGVAQRVAYQPGRIGGVPQQTLWTAISDHDQGLWFGSNGGGLLHLSAGAERFAVWQPDPVALRGLRDGRVRGVARDQAGNVWIGTLNAGLHRLDPGSGNIEHIAIPGLSRLRVWVIMADGDELWLGHQDGLEQLRRDASGLRHVKQWPATDLVGAMVDLLYKDQDGQIWAASMGAGLSEIDPKSGQIRHHSFGENGLVGTEAQQIGLGPDQQIWVATDQGLMRRERRCSCWKAMLSGVRVDAYAGDGDDGVYAFVDGDLVHFQWRDGLFRLAQEAPHAFAEFQTLGGMRMEQGALWMAGPQGLYRYWPGQNRLESFDTRDGLATRELSDRPFFAETNGRLWVGSEDGLISVDTRMRDAATTPARLRFDEIRVDGPEGSREIAPDSMAELQWAERELNVSLRLDTLARAHAQRFSYRLLGWDESWSEAAATPERRFGGLGDGDYALQVRAWDGNGLAAGNILEWQFKVLPPWWRSTLALLVYGSLLVLLVVAIERWRQLRSRSAAKWLETQRQAEWSERMLAQRTTLVAELSHEIRNPLNGVLGMGRLLAEQPLAETGRRYLNLLNDAGQQLLRLLDDMLDWSRLEAGAAPLPLQTSSLQQLLAPILQRYRQQAVERGLDFQDHVDANLRVQVDPPRLLQIVENLICNAIKFTTDGSVTIDAVAADRSVDVLVRDTGAGMTVEQAARLFRPFERVGDQRAAPGTGLGLAISRMLAERMGGSLMVQSEPGVGSCFTLVLQRTPDDEVSGLVEAKADSSVRRPSLSGRRLLVVDDDPIAREVLQRELEATGASAHLAADALSVLILVRQQGFDAALIDWDLPGLSGLELAQTLRQQQPQLRLIAVTGRGRPEDIAGGQEAGFCAHLVKPVQPRQLLMTLVEVLGATDETRL